MVVLTRVVYNEEYDVDLFEFMCKGRWVNWAYIGVDLLLEDEARNCYHAFFDVAKQLSRGPEDVQDALIRWRNRTNRKK